MGWEQFLEAFKALKLQDTMTALVLAAMAAFYIGTRLQKKISQFSTKTEESERDDKMRKEFTNHKTRVYQESIVLEGNVTGALQSIKGEMVKHEEKDDKRFEALDDKMTPRLDNMDKRVNKANLALARIQTALKIEVPEEDQ